MTDVDFRILVNDLYKFEEPHVKFCFNLADNCMGFLFAEEFVDFVILETGKNIDSILAELDSAWA